MTQLYITSVEGTLAPGQIITGGGLEGWRVKSVSPHTMTVTQSDDSATTVISVPLKPMAYRNRAERRAAMRARS